MAAEEWQLSWTADSVRARALLGCLRINPSATAAAAGQPSLCPGPLAVPLTFAIQAGSLSVALLAAPAPTDKAAAMPDATEELGSLECIGLKANTSA